MRRFAFLVAVALCVFSSLAFAGGVAGPLGPNPQAGDGVSDGSTLESPNGPNSAITLSVMGSADSGADVASNSGALGPNPQAGDGIPDGSSLDSPNGPNGSPK